MVSCACVSTCVIACRFQQGPIPVVLNIPPLPGPLPDREYFVTVSLLSVSIEVSVQKPFLPGISEPYKLLLVLLICALKPIEQGPA